MRLFSSVAGCALAVALMACGGKKAGGACTSTDDIACENALNVLACVSGKWASVPCPGVGGCTDSTTGTFCDLTSASAGLSCPPWAEGNQVCQFSPSALLKCTAGSWVATQTCASCTSATGAAVCTGGMPVGDGGLVVTDGGVDAGSTGSCSPANCTGCCSSAGVCIANRTGAACGTNGAACVDCGSGKTCDGTFQCVTSVGCGPSNCTDGCCANGQCVRPPQSPSDTACGPLGGSCNDCVSLGLVCNPTLRSCQTTATGGDAGTDACQGVPVDGECLSTTVVRFCAVSTGSGGNTVKTYACSGAATCQQSASGASCVSGSNSCTPGDQRCSANLLQECAANGTWPVGTSCGTGTCTNSTLGSFCAPPVATVTLTATLKYQVRTPVISGTGFFDQDWSAATTVLPARNVVVRSTTGTGSALKVIDTVTTNSAGQYTVKVPSTPSADDRVFFSAVGGDSLGVRFAVADPQFGTGEFQPGQDVTAPRLWGWSATVSNLTNGGTLTVTTAQGSGALNLFDELQQVYAQDRLLHQGVSGKTVVMWFGLNTTWSCGACFLDYPGSGFEAQVFMSGDSTDQAYWGDAVTSHELGHWALARVGQDDDEGAAEYIAHPLLVPWDDLRRAARGGWDLERLKARPRSSGAAEASPRTHLP